MDRVRILSDPSTHTHKHSLLFHRAFSHTNIHESTITRVTLLLFKSPLLNIASKRCTVSPLTPLLSLPPQAFSATVGQIHTWLQHLQLSWGLAHCHKDEPVQRQLPQLRLYLPAAGGSNDLRVSSPGRVQMQIFPNPYGTWWAQLYKLIQSEVHVFLAWSRPVTWVFEWLHQSKACMANALKCDSLWQKNTSPCRCQYFQLCHLIFYYVV